MIVSSLDRGDLAKPPFLFKSWMHIHCARRDSPLSIPRNLFLKFGASALWSFSASSMLPTPQWVNPVRISSQKTTGRKPCPSSCRIVLAGQWKSHTNWQSCCNLSGNPVQFWIRKRRPQIGLSEQIILRPCITGAHLCLSSCVFFFWSLRSLLWSTWGSFIFERESSVGWTKATRWFDVVE